ncbi:hypothetical protein SASPL_119882 [Salvia splendens]|uniref:CN hydrolase domain-containing protein n=1 Tax=Salvia splendens TaxID=180675 RepID=A0A8X8XTH1_SALSN|nr:hypothetical protein SASPL_119882 [Salvia splendens]
MAKSRIVTVAALQFACTDDVLTNVETAESAMSFSVYSRYDKEPPIYINDLMSLSVPIYSYYFLSCAYDIAPSGVIEGYILLSSTKGRLFHRAKPRKEHPTILSMQKLAKELGVILDLYRKSHIPDGPGEFYFNPGDTGFKVRTIELNDQSDSYLYRTYNCGICWDQWFPEAARAMVLQGAEILFYPTAIGSEPQDDGLDSRDHWKRVPLVASNRIGKEIIDTEHGKSEIAFYGNSPHWRLIANADDKNEAILVAEFDLDKIKSKRHSWGIFRDRRPDLYKVLLTLDGSDISL